MSKPSKYCPRCACRSCRAYQLEVAAKKTASKARAKRLAIEERAKWRALEAEGIPRGKKLNPKRNHMMWLLRFATRTGFGRIGKLFSRTGQTAQVAFLRANRVIEIAARREIETPTLAATQRLIAAGALLHADRLRDDIRAFDLDEFDRLFPERKQ